MSPISGVNNVASAGATTIRHKIKKLRSDHGLSRGLMSPKSNECSFKIPDRSEASQRSHSSKKYTHPKNSFFISNYMVEKMFDNISD